MNPKGYFLKLKMTWNTTYHIK